MRQIVVLVFATLLATGCQATRTPPPVLTPPAGVILTASGSGELNTATFDAPATFAVDYSYDCGNAVTYRVQISAVHAKGPDETLLTLGPPKAVGTTYGHGAGETYLSVGIWCPWTITVRAA